MSAAPPPTTTNPAAEGSAEPLPVDRRTQPVAARDAAVVLGVVTGVGAALRFLGLGRLPLWVDEAATQWFARQPLGDLFGERLRLEPNPPLYYALQHAWRVFGDSEVALRSLPALLGTLTIPLVYLLGAAVGGRRIGLVAAAVLATSPIHVQFSQEARAYPLVMAAAALALWGCVWLLTHAVEARRPTPRALGAWSAYVGGCVVAVYAHNTAVLLPALSGLAALGVWLWRDRGDWRLFGLWLLAGVAIAGAWSLWLPAVLEQAGRVGQSWHMPRPTPSVAVKELGRVYGHAHAGVVRPLADLLFVAAAALGVWRWRRQPGRLWPLVAVAAGVPLLTLAASFWTPMYVTRTLLWPLVAVVVLVAGGVWTVGPPRVRWLVLGAVLMAQFWGVGRFYARYSQNEPWDRAVAHVLADARPGDVVIAHPGYAQWAVEYYLDRAGADLPWYGAAPWREGDPELWATRAVYMTDPRDQPTMTLGEAVRPHDRVWLVRRGGDKPDPALEATLNGGGFERGGGTWFGRISVTPFTRDAAPQP